VHPHQLNKFNEICSTCNKRKSNEVSETPQKQAKKQKVDVMITGAANANLVSQAKVNELVVGFITEGLMPFSVVEMPSFKALVTGLQPNRSVISRPTVMKRISEKATLAKQNIKGAMVKVQHVATTTDCWTAHRRSFLGVTSHWLDEETLERESAALACLRLKGKHTYDVLAAKLEDIHTEYDIQAKIDMTTTDSGSNFVKAFSVFGAPATENCEQPDESNEVVFEDVSEDLTKAEDSLEYHLPPHHRCAAHSLNLVSTVDAEKAEENPVYKRLSRATFAKCQSLWNKSSRSSQAAEVVEDECGLVLLKPNATRWNSVFMAVERLVRIMKDKGENTVQKLCTEFGLPK
jgi:KRAB domain-containing zinc finger protein